MRSVLRHPALTCVLWAGLLVRGPAGLGAENGEAQAILKTAGVRGGLLVHLGCGDGKLTTALRAGECWLVQGLDRDAASVEKARRHVAGLGLYGKVSIDRLVGNRLPYADNAVNLLVAEDLGGVPMAEVTRVLSPNGVACLRQGGAWTRTVKPRPAELDEWTHFLHGPDNNAVSRDTVVGPPRHLQWVAGPRWARSHEYTASVSAAVSAGGRIFYIVDEGPTASVAASPVWSLVARDAFSGVLLWKRPIKEWQGHLGSFHDGLADLAKRLVAVGDRVYASMGIGEPLSALDAATGQTVTVYEGTAGARELVCDGKTLYVIAGDVEDQRKVARGNYTITKIIPRDLLALEAATGRKLWGVSDKTVPGTLAASGNRLFYQNPKEVVCLDAGTGQKQWAAPRPAPSDRVQGDAAPTLVVSDGVLVTAEGTWGGAQMAAISVETGKELWNCKARQPLSNAVDVFAIGGMLWTGIWTGRTSLPQPLDLKSGQPAKLPSENLVFLGDQPSGHHHRCYRNKATVRYLLTARRGVEFIDFAAARGYAFNAFRGTCQYGIMPANGLLYLPPNSCGCYIQANLTGFKAMTARRQASPAPAGSDADRLEKGPAYGAIRIPNPASAIGDWPTYRGDAFRSGRARSAGPAGLQPAWSAELGGPLSAPVVAAGRAFVAQIDAHAVHALDAKDGHRLWSFTAGGRVDSPPTVCGEAVFFGSADGWVYCLRASDGALAWRFRAAPDDVRLVAWDQIESVWPVHGSVLVTPGEGATGAVVWCAAGRSSYLSGGIHVCRIDAATGKLLSGTQLDTTGPDPENPPAGKFTGPGMEEACLPDVLSSDGQSVFMRHVRFDMSGKRQVEKRKDPGVRHLYSNIGFLDDSWWQRSYWVLGAKMHLSHGLEGWDREALSHPFGRILAVDEKLVFGFGRDDLGGGYSGGHVGLAVKNGRRASHYRLFAADHDPGPKQQRGGAGTEPPDEKKGKKGAKGGEEDNSKGFITWGTRWAQNPPILVRAMTATEDRLLVAGPPAGEIAELGEALAGGKGGLLQALSKADGKMLAELKLDSAPVFDGLAVSGGRLYLSGTDGKLRCFGKQ